MKNVSGHLAVLRSATTYARSICKNESIDRQEQWDLMDAIHNTAQHIEKDLWKEEEYLAMYYEPYDKKWGNQRLNLMLVYKEACGKAT